MNAGVFGLLLIFFFLLAITDIALAGEYFHKCLQKSIVMRERHRTQASKYSATFPASTITEWKAAVKAWEDDYTKPDPYAEPEYSECWFFERDPEFQCSHL